MSLQNCRKQSSLYVGQRTNYSFVHKGKPYICFYKYFLLLYSVYNAQICAKGCECVHLLCFINFQVETGMDKTFSSPYSNPTNPFWKRGNLWQWSWHVTQRTNTPTTLLLLWHVQSWTASSLTISIERDFKVPLSRFEPWPFDCQHQCSNHSTRMDS